MQALPYHLRVSPYFFARQNTGNVDVPMRVDISGGAQCIKAIPEALKRFSLMNPDRSVFLSNHSVTPLSRCCSHGSNLSYLYPNQRRGLEGEALRATQHAARPVQIAAHAKHSDTKARGILHGSLAEERPDLARQWIPEKNGSRTPESVAAAASFEVSWRCDIGCELCGGPHEWTARVVRRTVNGRGCPFCSGLRICRCRSLGAKHPQLMKQWDWDGNQGIDAYGVGCHSHVKVSWICNEHGHWLSSPSQRVKGQGCPECARERKRGPCPQRGSVKDELPDVYAELHPTKNDGLDLEKLTCGSEKKVSWLCKTNSSRPEGCHHEHSWKARVSSRCNQRSPTGCPFCSGRRVCPCNSLAGLHPALMQYWDFAGNAALMADPSWLGLQSNRRVWWRHECADGQVHRWCAKIESVVTRYKAQGRVPCPGCAGAISAAQFAKRRGQLIRRK